MSENKKEKVQIKLTLEGPIKDFLEKEAELECRKVTAHIRYIVNKYYAERMRTLSSHSGSIGNNSVPSSDYMEPIVHSGHQGELRVINTNPNEPIVPSSSAEGQKSYIAEQESDSISTLQETLIEEDLTI